jgi:hypothetical protein
MIYHDAEWSCREENDQENIILKIKYRILFCHPEDAPSWSVGSTLGVRGICPKKQILPIILWSSPTENGSSEWQKWNLAHSREEFDRSRDEEPCEDRDDESHQRTDHSFFGFVDSWAISRDTRVDLHLDSVIDERKYRNRTSDTEENIDHTDDDLWYGSHIDIASSEISIGEIIAWAEDIFSVATTIVGRRRWHTCRGSNCIVHCRYCRYQEKSKGEVLDGVFHGRKIMYQKYIE